MESYIGIDIGGTKISGIRIQGDSIQHREMQDTGASRPLEQIIATLYDVIDKLMIRDVVAIGVGVPGILNVKKGEIIAINNIPAFNGCKLKEFLTKKYSLPVYINNDANCFALSEAYFGAGKGFRNILGVTLGTGVGGGIVIDRKVYSGNLGAAGEFGCIPYKGDFFELYGGSKFFEKYYNATGEEIYERAEQGEQEAKDIFMDYGTHIAILLKMLLVSFAPEAIIIGGSISHSFVYFEPSIKEMLDSFPIPVIAKNVKILQAQLKDSGELGAAALSMSEMEKS
ncbi:ROK family protein [Bacteroidota bacterium]